MCTIHFIVVLSGTFQMTNPKWQLFTWLLTIWIASSLMCLFEFFVHVPYSIVFLLKSLPVAILCIFQIRFYYQLCILNSFSFSVNLPFHLQYCLLLDRNVINVLFLVKAFCLQFKKSFSLPLYYIFKDSLFILLH